MAHSIDEAVSIIHKHTHNFLPKVGIILGSGLASVAEQIENPVAIPFQAFGIETGSVFGHASLLVMGTLQQVPVLCLKGRLHLYEGTPFETVRTLIRIVKQLGVHTLIVTGAAGSLREDMVPGDIMVINDHLNFMPINPLVGPNDESIGPRFLSMREAYNPGLIDTFKAVGSRLQISLKQGVYLSLLGPSYETAAEIRAFRTLGADAVGMSVVPEVIVARHCDMRVLGVAAITNLAEGLSKEVLSHEATVEQGKLASLKMSKLIANFIKDIGPNRV